MAVSRIDEAGLNINQYGNRNLIINGAMKVAQRGTSSTNTNTFGSVDRFFMSASALDELAITQTQASDGPSGFSKSFKVTITTAESSLAADELFSMRHRIEAQNLQLLDFNTSSAKTVTVSFYVKSSITGTYAFAIYNADAGRNITNTYTIDSANTWERKTITIAGDTSGVIDDNNGYAFELSWILSAGTTYTGGSGADSWHTYANNKYAAGHAVDVASTLNATWQVTGVQLEVGDTATDFEHRTFGDELRRCQRYFIRFKRFGASGALCNISYYTASAAYGTIHFPTDMRSNPSMASSSGTNDFRIYAQANGGETFNSVGGLQAHETKCMVIQISSLSGLEGAPGWLECATTSATLDFSSEL